MMMLAMLMGGALLGWPACQHYEDHEGGGMVLIDLPSISARVASEFRGVELPSPPNGRPSSAESNTRPAAVAHLSPWPRV
jgi:hypothetical protein